MTAETLSNERERSRQSRKSMYEAPTPSGLFVGCSDAQPARDASGRAVGERTQENRVGHTEDGDRGSDPQRECRRRPPPRSPGFRERPRIEYRTSARKERMGIPPAATREEPAACHRWRR
jgi:hypothetical protein